MQKINLEVAFTILDQLGGKRFLAMTGSNNFVPEANSLTMTLVKNKSKANRLKITLTPMDTYTMSFYRYSPSKATITDIVATFKDVYCDQLQEIFTDVTGLNTHF